MPVTGARVALRVSPRWAVPEMVGEAAPNCGLFKMAWVVAVNTDAEPAPGLLLRTVRVTLANKNFPAIASVGSMVEAV